MSHVHSCKFHDFSAFVLEEGSIFPFLHKIKNSNNFIFSKDSNPPTSGKFLIAGFAYIDSHGFTNSSNVFCPILNVNNMKEDINNKTVSYDVSDNNLNCFYDQNDQNLNPKFNIGIYLDWGILSSSGATAGKTGCSPFSYIDSNGIVHFKDNNNDCYIPMFCFNDQTQKSYFAYCLCTEKRYNNYISNKITASTQWAHCTTPKVTPQGLIHDSFKHLP